MHIPFLVLQDPQWEITTFKLNHEMYKDDFL